MLNLENKGGYVMNCKHCNKPFYPKNGRFKYCSTECRLDEKKIQMVSISKTHAEERKKLKKIKQPIKPKQKQTIAEINILAKNAGMTYGEYVSKMGVNKIIHEIKQKNNLR